MQLKSPRTSTEHHHIQMPSTAGAYVEKRRRTVMVPIEKPVRVSKNSLPSALVMSTSQEYTERGAHISAASTLSLMNTCPVPSSDSFLQGVQRCCCTPGCPHMPDNSTIHAR